MLAGTYHLGVIVEHGIEKGTNIFIKQKCGGNNKPKIGWVAGKRKQQKRSDMFYVVKKAGRGSEMKPKEHGYRGKSEKMTVKHSPRKLN